MSKDQWRGVYEGLLPILSGVGAFLLGDWTVVLQVLLVLIVLDVASGWLRAFIQGNLSSKESWQGVAKKVGLLLLVVLGQQAGLILGFDGLRDMVAGFLAMTEGLSVLENLAASGIPFPDWLRQRLEEAKESKFSPPHVP